MQIPHPLQAFGPSAIGETARYPEACARYMLFGVSEYAVHKAEQSASVFCTYLTDSRKGTDI